MDDQMFQPAGLCIKLVITTNNRITKHKLFSERKGSINFNPSAKSTDKVQSAQFAQFAIGQRSLPPLDQRSLPPPPLDPVCC